MRLLLLDTFSRRRTLAETASGRSRARAQGDEKLVRLRERLDSNLKQVIQYGPMISPMPLETSPSIGFVPHWPNAMPLPQEMR